MSDPIVSLDTSLIREGKLDELKRAVAELVEFIRSNEPRPIVYQVYVDDGFTELVTLSTLDVYGKPSGELLELLRRKVQMLGDATVTVHDLQAGFARI